MKYLIAAAALVIAAPAAAQSPPATQHQDHSQHQQHGQGHGQHQQGQHQQGQHQQGQHQQGQHQAHRDCCADRNGNGRMDCCEAMAEAGDRRGCCPEQAPAPSAQPQGHDGH